MSKQLYHTVYVIMIDGCKFTMYSGWHYGKFSDIKHDIILFESFDELMDWLSANSWFSGGLCRWDYKLFGKVQRKIVSGDYVFTATYLYPDQAPRISTDTETTSCRFPVCRTLSSASHRTAG